MGRGTRHLVAVAVTTLAVLATSPVPGGAQTPVQDADPVCATEAGSGTPSAEDGVLTITTYNILHTQPDLADRSADTRIEAIADALAAEGGDVIGMQEVTESDNHGSFAQRIAAGLATRTGDDWTWCWYASNPHCPDEPDAEDGGRGGPCSAGIADQSRSGDSSWYEGVAILTRYEVTAVDAHRLIGRAQEIPLCAVEQPDNPLCTPTLTLDTRTIVYARIDTPFGAVDAAVSHLANDETSLSEQTRQLQVTDALNHLDGLVQGDGTPDVYVGDFNTLEGSPVWQTVIDEGFLDGFREAEPTADGLSSGQDLDAPGSTVHHRIDYVFVRPGSCPTAVEAARMVGDAPVPFEDGVVWPSDHYGVAVDLDLAGDCTVAPDVTSDPGDQGQQDDSDTQTTSLPQTGGTAPAAVALGLALAGLLLLRGPAARRRAGGPQA